MLDLKNCPFCGGKATLHSPCGALGAWISCAGCGLEGPTETGVTEDEAIAAWNRRALQAVGPEPAVAVKPLEWRGSEGVWHKADAEFGGHYRITQYVGMQKPYKLETHGWWVGSPCGHYELLDEAKAAAQADYASRIRSALVATPPAEPTPGQFAERVIAACRGYMNTYDVLAKEIRENMQFCMAEALRAADAVTNPVNTSTELTVLKADIDEFMRRLGPRWFLEQGWFPETVNATLASLREADHA